LQPPPRAHCAFAKPIILNLHRVLAQPQALVPFMEATTPHARNQETGKIKMPLRLPMLSETPSRCESYRRVAQLRKDA
jgi:hypothetical protein